MATATGTILMVDSVASELADTAARLAGAQTVSEAKHARARALGDALGLALACYGRSPLLVPAIGSTVDWAYDTKEKQRWVDAFARVLVAGWASMADFQSTLEAAFGEAGAKQLVGSCYLDALDEFRRVDDATPPGTFSAAYWADRYAKKAVGKLTKSFVGKVVIGDRLGKLGQELAVMAQHAGKRLYSIVRDGAGTFVGHFKNGLRLWCGEWQSAIVSDGMIIGTGPASATTKEKTISSDAWKRSIQQIEADALMSVVLKEEEKERVAQIVRDIDAARGAADPGFVRMGFLQIGVSSGSICCLDDVFPRHGAFVDQTMASLDTYSAIKAYVKRYITWALACEELGLVVSHDIPMDPRDLLKTWLPGPFIRKTPDGVEHVFYNRNYDPPGCVVV